MIRRLVDQAFNSGKYYISAVGLSTDVKPTEGIITGSKFVEVDTGIGYLFDETSGEWNENQQLSEAVAAYLGDHPEVIDQAAIEAMFGERLDGIDEDLGELKSALGNINNLNTDDKSSAVAAINEVNGRFLDGVAEAVDDWLDNHPEATTTVQDGSLTDAKFSDLLKLKTLNDYVTPEMFADSDDIDDTGSILRAINYAKTENISVVKFKSKKYITSETIYVPSKVYLVGENQSHATQGIFSQYQDQCQTMISCEANVNAIEFDDNSAYNGIIGICIIGNNTAIDGIKIDNTQNKSGKNYVKNVIIDNFTGYGVYIGGKVYEAELRSVQVAHCNTGLFIAGGDCTIYDVCSAYNANDGIVVTKGGTLRAFNVDSWGNSRYGLNIYDVMTLRFVLATINDNAQHNVYISKGSAQDSYSPSNLYFIGSRIFGCGENYSEIYLAEVEYGARSITFSSCSLGSYSRSTQGAYIVDDEATNKNPLQFVGCAFSPQNYTAAFKSTLNTYAEGCVNTYNGDYLNLYNIELRQKGGALLQSIGTSYHNGNFTLSAADGESLIVCNPTTNNMQITLPAANTVKAGKLYMIARQDGYENQNTITLVKTGNDYLFGKSTISYGESGVVLSTDGSGKWFAI